MGAVSPDGGHRISGPSVDRVTTDYLYPLEQTGRNFTVNDEAATPEVMEDEARKGHGTYLLTKHWTRVSPLDRIWFRASAPEGRVVAVGVVQTWPYKGTDGQWRIVVDVNELATKLLQKTTERPSVRAPRNAVWRATTAETSELHRITNYELLLPVCGTT